MQSKSPVGLSQVIFVATLLDNVLQSMNLETFYLNRTKGAYEVRKSSISLEIRIFWKLLKFWWGQNVQHLIASRLSGCFIIKVDLAYYTLGVHSTKGYKIFSV